MRRRRHSEGHTKEYAVLFCFDARLDARHDRDRDQEGNRYHRNRGGNKGGDESGDESGDDCRHRDQDDDKRSLCDRGHRPAIGASAGAATSARSQRLDRQHHASPHRPARNGRPRHCRRPQLPVDDGDTLVCVCRRGALCHRQVAAAVLARAGWRVVLEALARRAVSVASCWGARAGARR